MQHNLTLLAFLCALLLPITSFAFEADGEIFEPEPTIETDEQGFSLHFSGDAEKEGALKLFVKAYEADDDPTAAELNQITPAAGVKLKFEF